jgi:lysophospholipase L1-like esterase
LRICLVALVWLSQLMPPVYLLRWLGSADAELPRGPLFGLLGMLCVVWILAAVLPLGHSGFRRWLRRQLPGLVCAWLMCTFWFGVSEAFMRHKAFDVYYGVPNLRSSRELGWRLEPGKAGVAANGWREPEVAHAHPASTYRIVALGDSTTFGQGVDPLDAYPAQLQRLLNQDPEWTAHHPHTEVVNLGVPAYGPDQELRALELEGMAFHPDLVVLHLCTNDFADSAFSRDWRPGHKPKPSYRLENGRLVLIAIPPGAEVHAHPRVWPLDRFVLVNFARDAIYRWLDPHFEEFKDADVWPLEVACKAQYEQARPLVWALVAEMARTARQGGSDFLVTLSPTHFSGISDRPPQRAASFLLDYHADAQRRGLRAFDCVADYFAQGYTHATHLRPAGNLLVAKSIEAAIVHRP